MAQFIPGLDLNRAFYVEVVQPLLATRFPDLVYSAGLIGYGSDVLGYDTERSTDHEWGPRLLLFVTDEDYSALARAIDDTLRRELSPIFRGYSTNFSAPDAADGGVRLLAPGIPGAINHHITLATVSSFVQSQLGIRSADSISRRDWLAFPEQHLLEVTAGAIYHDGLGQLVLLRQRLSYYPDDVWRYRLACQWQRISQEEAFVGRCAEVGDELGSRIIAARLARDLMRLCFLLERRYAPYNKWLGTAFARLDCAEYLLPRLTGALSASQGAEREQYFVEMYEAVAGKQNARALAEPQDPASRLFHGRPYRVIHAERFATALAAAIRDEELQHLIDTVGLVGAVDQFVDCTDILECAETCHHLVNQLDG